MSQIDIYIVEHIEGRKKRYKNKKDIMKTESLTNPNHKQSNCLVLSTLTNLACETLLGEKRLRPQSLEEYNLEFKFRVTQLANQYKNKACNADKREILHH